MALNPAVRYPGQTSTTDPDGYPYGAAKNEATFKDGTGTPLEKDLINDIFGLQQALLAAAEITPSGTPDKVGSSQYLTAIQAIIAVVGDALDARVAKLERNVGRPGRFTIASQATGDNEPLDLTEAADPAADYGIESATDIRVERSGYYLVSATITVSSIGGATIEEIGLEVRCNSTLFGDVHTTYDQDNDSKRGLSVVALVRVTDRDSQTINIRGRIPGGTGMQVAGTVVVMPAQIA